MKITVCEHCEQPFQSHTIEPRTTPSGSVFAEWKCPIG